MTDQQAIEEFKKRLEIHDYEKQIPEYYEAMRMAIKALEKPIPKKPIMHRENEYEFYYTCPICNSMKIIGEFCNDCCQRIDWSEEIE